MARQLTYKRGGIPLEAELCLLICSMFPEDSRIPIEDLVIYVMGLKLSEDVHDMFEARYRVHDSIPIIHDPEDTRNIIGDKIRLRREKDEYDNQYVRMLVGAHDLANSISSRYKWVFRSETVIEQWPKASLYKDCYGLSLVLKKIKKYPFSLECPKLALLQLQYGDDSQSLPIDFFEGMEELRVLSLDVPSLPQSVVVLKNLRTLRLKVIKSRDMSAIGGLTNLEFLSISTSCLTDIPREMKRLSNLRLLDLRKMHLAYIPPGVFLNFSKLEELYLPLSFTRWGCMAKEEDDYDEQELVENDAKERINASLGEIGSLSLKVLQINVPNALILPKKSVVFKNIRQFKILVPSNLKYQLLGKGSINELQLRGEACDIEESEICDLMSRTEDLTLTRVRNLKNVNNMMYQLKDDDFLQLKKMIITECEELECLFDTEDWTPSGSFWGLRSLHLSMLSNLKEIWHGTRTRSHFDWFVNLKLVNIRFCHKLKYVFPLSIARRLNRLQSIEILDCNEMEGVFYRNEVEDDTNEVYFIEELHLHSLPKLVCFLTQNDNTIIDGVNDDTTNVSWTTDEVSLVKDKDALSHMEMHCALSSKLITRLIYLEKLRIAYCDALEVIFSFTEKHETTWVLNSLKELELYGLRNLKHLWYQIPSDIPAFKNLQLLVLSECRNSYLLSPRVAKHLVQLRKIQISRCEKMEEIVARDDEEVEANLDGIVFPQLKVLELQYMPNTRIFYGGIYAIELPLLESLKLNECNKMDSFSYGSLNTPMLVKMQLNGSLYSVIGDLNATIKRLNADKL